LQAEIIAGLLAGRDALAVMPTGSGKSLCYQLPSLLFDGLTVVVSPLISLMQDQVMQLRDLGVPAVFLNSALDHGDYIAAAGQVRAGETRLLYTSPETLLRPETLVLLDRSRVRCLAIDEAHCISEWGHDFRPEYRQLLPVRRRYADAACIALTATATERVRRDIQERLGIRAGSVFVASFNRPNLFLEVQARSGGFGQAHAFLQAHREQSGIIYCSTREGVERLAAFLVDKGWAALPYHAGMDAETRRRNQEQFSRDRVPIIVAAIAFGMGINKSNVRFVLHFNLPKDLESYYQEIGRAGRDGLRADCLLLYSRQDLITISHFIEEGAASERPGRQARLQAMARYAEAEGCRRIPLLQYFGEEADDCGFCDNCLAARGERPRVDVSDAARLFLECVRLTGQMFGTGHIVEVLRGSRSQRVRQHHHDQLPTYAAGREYSAAQWRALADAFIRQGLLEQDMEHGGLRLCPRDGRCWRGPGLL
jgi:ATP-dependent DNA helicase RecQ